MEDSFGRIEVDMFPPDVDSLEHPDVIGFRELLEEVAVQYHCRLLFFDIDHGTVSFSFDSELLMVDIMRVLKNDGPDEP
jgi:hypothetical protein